MLPGEVKEVSLVHELGNGDIVVEPYIGSIYHADLRYFTGQRRAEVLARKLLWLLCMRATAPSWRAGPHIYKTGTGGTIIERGSFLSSGKDGLAQHRIVLPEQCVVAVPEDVPRRYCRACGVMFGILLSSKPFGRQSRGGKSCRVRQFTAAMRETAEHRGWKKTVLAFNWM
ncbi:hypothetical protein [Paenibacillus thalictri]|uniref:Uncharacterized protein n=1 Tax=Paenibacillus thalictri TaxID=2527873 RepID=A0A4Q9DJS2_9BACL|nr:hypothetical protein [Paenibacillus thalictri]TBL74649.1 hypothetical protein EYB31_25370 [Paenibacillus thalictri]